MPAGWATADMPGQHGRTVLVTGANSGIGFQAALELARHGAVVLLACRDAGRGGAARGAIVRQVPAAAVDLVALDLADLDSVARLAGQVLDRADGLDLLINNAGVMAVPSRQVTAQGFELQFGTNHLGHFALTLCLLPVLLARPGSRVVTVSSLVHRFGSIRLEDLQAEHGYGRWRAYSQSKLANALFTLELDRLAARGRRRHHQRRRPPWLQPYRAAAQRAEPGRRRHFRADDGASRLVHRAARRTRRAAGAARRHRSPGPRRRLLRAPRAR